MDPAAVARSGDDDAALALTAHADKQRHLLQTYEITTRKPEAELRARDTEAERARAALANELCAAWALEERAHPGRTRTLVALDDLHLSGLNATHFLTALRHAVKSVRGFARARRSAERDLGRFPCRSPMATRRDGEVVGKKMSNTAIWVEEREGRRFEFPLTSDAK
jgi:hypothetical protein